MDYSETAVRHLERDFHRLAMELPHRERERLPDVDALCDRFRDFYDVAMATVAHEMSPVEAADDAALRAAFPRLIQAMSRWRDAAGETASFGRRRPNHSVAAQACAMDLLEVVGAWCALTRVRS